jgi:uracil-DNA glycosylase family 4
MIKKNSRNSIKLIKLIKYYKFINYNLIYNDRAINRYKKDNFEISADKVDNLEKLKKSISNIKNCSLKSNATNIVFSDGNPKSKIMLIGEAPGSNEDQEGLPFVGRAGTLLDKMLASINLDRKNVYISNIINYRPPENRRPTDEEMNRYLPFVKKHIEIIAPKILILLGSTAMNTLIGNNLVISEVRGQWIEKEFGKCKTSVIVTFHPSFLMRQPTQKKLAWVDLQMIRDKKAKLNI